jgi:hypothetical protein
LSKKDSALRAVEPHVELPALAGEVPESTEARGARNLGPKKYHNCFSFQSTLNFFALT